MVKVSDQSCLLQYFVFYNILILLDISYNYVSMSRCTPIPITDVKKREPVVSCEIPELRPEITLGS